MGSSVGMTTKKAAGSRLTRLLDGGHRQFGLLSLLTVSVSS